jgi:hypothetical protein
LFGRWREVVLSMVSVTVALCFSEAVFRFYLGQKNVRDLERVEKNAAISRVDTCSLGDIVRLSEEPDLFYELKPHLEGRFCGGAITTNSLGMRMPIEPELHKPPNVFRIVGVGDSYLFGQGVDDGQGFLEVLQARAFAAGRPLEVLNFGVPGYNSWMESVVLETRARLFEPDVIVVSVVGNDWDLPTLMLSRPRGNVLHSFLLGTLYERLRGPPALLDTPRSHVYEDHYLAAEEEVPPAFRHMTGFESYRRALVGMLHVASALHARLVLFSDCLEARSEETKGCRFPFAAGEYERVQSEVYTRPGVTLCPWRLKSNLLIPRDGHPTAEGHVSLADQLSACLERAGIGRP